MALQTEMVPSDVPLNGNLFFNFGQIVLMNDPSMFSLNDNVSSDNSVVLEPINSKNLSLNFQEFGMEASCFPIDRVTDYTEVAKTSDLTFHYYNEFNNGEGYKGMKMLPIPIICNNTPRDQPEFVDVNSLTESILDATKSPAEECITISDEDEVIFVGEYKEKGKRVAQNLPSTNHNKQDGIRRNPVRKARNSRAAADFSKELIFEEDFAFFDHSDDDRMEYSKKPSPLKAWPVNAHERPEYNSLTEQVESLDYNLRNTQKSVPKKKPRLETVRVTRKSKKRYFTRKRKPRVPVVEKVPISDLIPLVKTTSEMVKDFLKISDEYKTLLGNSTSTSNAQKAIDKGKLQLESNQNILAFVVNGFAVKLKKLTV